MFVLHWDLGRGWEKFSGESKRACLIEALKSRGFGITENEGVLYVRKDSRIWNVYGEDAVVTSKLLDIARDELPFGIGKIEMIENDCKCITSLNGEKISFEDLLSASHFFSRMVWCNELFSFDFTLAGLTFKLSNIVSDDEGFEGRKILTSTLYVEGLQIEVKRKFYIRFFKDNDDEDFEFLKKIVFEKISSSLFMALDKKLCEKIEKMARA